MPDKESRAERYRRLAQECLQIAQTLPVGERRTTLIEMAQVWQRLSAQQEAAVQRQQQQIQPKDDDKKE